MKISADGGFDRERRDMELWFDITKDGAVDPSHIGQVRIVSFSIWAGGGIHQLWWHLPPAQSQLWKINTNVYLPFLHLYFHFVSMDPANMAIFLAVQDSSIGDLVSAWLINSASDTFFILNYSFVQWLQRLQWLQWLQRQRFRFRFKLRVILWISDLVTQSTITYKLRHLNHGIEE